jgi:spore coat protein SA
VDLQQFRPATLQQRQRLRKKYDARGAFVFAFAGRIIPRKGLPILMKAFAHVRKALPQVKLVVAGSGKKHYIARLKRTAHSLRIPVKFIGYRPHRVMHQTYWLADCFVCPSQKHEAFGLVNVEAMAAGLPVIASQIGGIKEVVQHGKNGLLVDKYKSPKAFGKAMLKLARDHSLTDALGKQARADTAHRFSWNNTANTLMGMYVK